MGEEAAYAVLAMQQAIDDSGLRQTTHQTNAPVLSPDLAGPSTANLLAAADITREKRAKARRPIWFHAACHRQCLPVLQRFQNSRYQLFDLVSLFDLGTLYHSRC